MPTVLANLVSTNKGMFTFYLSNEADGELAVGGYDDDQMQGNVN